MVYRASVLRGLAIAQMVFGALMVVFGVACIFSVDNWTSHVAFGIWVGVWVLVSGILGYVGAKDDSRPNQCLIGCFMGFSVTACVIAGTMFICYCTAVADFAKVLRCKNYDYYDYRYDYDCYYSRYYSSSERHNARVGAGLGSCQLIFAIVEFFVALASSIYCCNAVCCGAPAVGSVTANQQVMFLQPGQQIYPGGQGGVVVIQPSGAMTTVPQGYAMPGQPAMYVPQQPMSVQLPPAYSVQPAGATPAGMVAVSYAGATMPPQTQVQGPPKDHERPPPYAFTQGGNAPPSASASGAASAAGMPGVMEV